MSHTATDYEILRNDLSTEASRSAAAVPAGARADFAARCLEILSAMDGIAKAAESINEGDEAIACVRRILHLAKLEFQEM